MWAKLGVAGPDYGDIAGRKTNEVVAEYTASGEAIPYCRTGQGTPFRSEPRRTGHGAVSAIEAGHVCAKCVDLVPRATLCAITDA